MRKRGVEVVLLCASLQCGNPQSQSSGVRPSEEGEVGVEDGAEEPTSAAPGEDPAEIGALAQSLMQVLPSFGWRPMTASTSVGFQPRSDASVVRGRDSMLIFGGRLSDGTYSSELAGYDPNTNSWTLLPAAPLSGRSHAIAVWTGQKVYLWGGRNATYRHMSSGAVYVLVGPNSGRWYTIRSAPHILKCDPQGVWSVATQELLVFGCTGSASSGYVAGGLAYRSGAQTWRELPTPPLSARIGARVVFTNSADGTGGKLVVFGGGDPLTRAPFWDGGAYDPVSNSWQPINATVPREEAWAFGGEPRIYAALGLATGRYREQASFWGGRPADDATAYDDGGGYIPQSASWRSIPSSGSALAESQRRYVSAWSGADRLFIWGGQRYVAGQPRSVLGNGAAWNPLHRTWTPLEAGGPTPRARASAVWMSSEVIVWGGYDLEGGTERLLVDGMIYHPTPRALSANAVVAGTWSSCAFTHDGSLECWGVMSPNTADPDVNLRRSHAIRGVFVEDGFQLSVGSGHGCARTGSDGVIRCWGNNIFGQLGVPDREEAGPVVVPLPRPAAQVSTGDNHACAVLDSREVWCWGLNNFGQLGNGATSQTTPPVKVSDLGGVVQISPGKDHTCAVLTGGAARCWGRGEFGKLGDGTVQNRTTPVAVVGLVDVAQIAAGGFLTCARKHDGAVLCWGRNSSGELGRGSMNHDDNPTPLPVHGLSDAVALSTGSRHACAVRTGGWPVCWGDNVYGQLGDASGVQRQVPTPVLGLSDIAELDAGFRHTCGRSRSGKLWCWGENDDGQLGDGTNVRRLAPQPVVW